MDMRLLLFVFLKWKWFYLLIKKKGSLIFFLFIFGRMSVGFMSFVVLSSKETGYELISSLHSN